MRREMVVLKFMRRAPTDARQVGAMRTALDRLVPVSMALRCDRRSLLWEGPDGAIAPTHRVSHWWGTIQCAGEHHVGDRQGAVDDVVSKPRRVSSAASKVPRDRPLHDHIYTLLSHRRGGL
jgi:hypothetical protein